MDEIHANEQHTDSNVGLAFGLTLAAGLSTCLGGAIVFSSRMASLQSKNLLASSLAFSAGVMIEIATKSKLEFQNAGYSLSDATLYFDATFFAGIIVTYILFSIVEAFQPHDASGLTIFESEAYVTEKTTSPKTSESSNEETQYVDIEIQRARMIEEEYGDHAERSQLKTTGLVTALSLALHNFPEGLALYIAALDDPTIGGAFALAIGIHNIPEGIAVAMPVYYATGTRWKGFSYSVLSAMAEPFGACIGMLIPREKLNHEVFAIVFGFVGGMMVCIVFKEILPTATKYATQTKRTEGTGSRYTIHQNSHLVACYCFLGMAVMAFSLVLIG